MSTTPPHGETTEQYRLRMVEEKAAKALALIEQYHEKTGERITKEMDKAINKISYESDKLMKLVQQNENESIHRDETIQNILKEEYITRESMKFYDWLLLITAGAVIIFVFRNVILNF